MVEFMKKYSNSLPTLTQEQRTDGFNKIVMSDDFVQALNVLKEARVMKHVIPELEETFDMTQNAYHFGTVWEHTLKAVEIACVNSNRLEVRLAALLHDIGKIRTRTVGDDGRVHFYDHESAGAVLVDDILKRMGYSETVIDEVKFYTKWHMYTKSWGDCCERMKDGKLRKLEYVCGTMDRFTGLLHVIDADNKSHAAEHVMASQCRNIMNRVQEHVAEGTAMFGYELPVGVNDVMDKVGVDSDIAARPYMDHCLRLAFNNPMVTRDELLKRITSDKIRGIN